jgi:cytochrome b561
VRQERSNGPNLAREIVTATRIAAGDDRTRYDGVAITLHWLTAGLVAEQFIVAQAWGFFERPTRQVLLSTHTSFGVLLAAVLAVRIIWRLVPGHQVRAADVGWVEIASKAVHYILYTLLACEVTLGIAARWSDNKPLSVFGWLLPSPFGSFSKDTHHLVMNAHEWIAWLIIGLVAMHAAGALFHHYVLHDDVLTRMLPPRTAA